MDSTFLWAQAFGFCAMCLCICAWQAKSSRSIIRLYVPISLLWGIQYILLGAYSAVSLCILGAIKDSFLGFHKKIDPKYIIITFLTIIWSIGLARFEVWHDILPLLAGTFINFGLLQPDNRQLIARMGILSQCSWISYNFIVGSWMGFLCCIFVITSSIIGMARHEEWEIGRCRKTFAPSVARSLFVFPTFRTYP